MLRLIRMVALLGLLACPLIPTAAKADPIPPATELVQPAQYYYGRGYYHRPYVRRYYRPLYYGPRSYHRSYYYGRRFYRPY